MRRTTKFQRAKKRVRTQPRIETLELRQMLTASPELLVDLNTTPARTPGHKVLWESSDNETVWVQNVPDEGTGTLTQLTFIGSAGDTSSTKIDGNVVNHSVVDGNLYLEVTKDDVTNLWVTDGTSANTELADAILPVTSNLDSLALTRVSDDSVELRLRLSPSGDALADLGNLSFDSFLDSPVAVGDRLYFRLQRISGIELWFTDGTEAGTGKLEAGQTPTQLFGFQDHLIYKGSHSSGRGLLVADQSGEIRPLLDANGEPLDESANISGVSDSLLFGTTLRPDGKADYWVVDDSLVAREPFGTFSQQRPTAVVSHPHSFQFRADNQSWRTDGTPEGTVEITFTSSSYALADQQFELTRTNSIIELWYSNNVGAEPVLLATDLSLNSRFVDDENGKVYFVTRDELWSTDGTVAGTVFVSESILDYKVSTGVVAGDRLVVHDGMDVWSHRIGESPEIAFRSTATDGSSPSWVAQLGEIDFYRTGRDPTLWAVHGDGTAELLFEAPSSEILKATVVGDWAYFLVTPISEDSKLIRTQGTAASTEHIADLPGGATELTAVGDKLFALTQPRRDDRWLIRDGTEIWTSNGTTEGTVFVAEAPANAIALSWVGNEFNPVSFDGRLYFSTFDPNAPLWQSDGTAEGTHGVSLPNLTKARGVRVVGDKLFFVGYRENETSGEVFYLDRDNGLHETGVEIEVSEFLLKAHTTDERYVVGGRVFTDEGQISRFAATDGTSEDRFEVDSTIELTTVGSKIFYSTRNANRQYEYYSTDGTPEGTQLYFRETAEYETEDLGDGSIRFHRLGGDSVSEFVSDETHVYLRTGDAIWKSDGTPASTIKIADIENVSPKRGISPSIIPTATGHLHFIAGNSEVGEEIFRIADTPEPIPGDIDHDFDVDFADFLVLSENFGNDVDGAMADGDLDASGTVDFADFLLMAENYGEDLKRPL